jgi:hypothetical protein
MVQTPKGAGDNPWISYMRACASNYHAGVSQNMLKSPAKPKATTKAKPAKLMDAKDASRIHKDMKASGAAQAKERAKETKKK